MADIQGEYDVIVLGAGPAGNSCASQCAELGLKTLCIDNLQATKGSRAFNLACTKSENLGVLALLETAKAYTALLNDHDALGINAAEATVDITQAVKRKNQLIADIGQDIADQMLNLGVDCATGKAELVGPSSVEFTSDDKSTTKKTLRAKHIILASESKPVSLPFAAIDNHYILEPLDALNMGEAPKRIAVIGGGIIGLEIGGIWNKLGSETILLEAQESFLGLVDHQISRLAYQIFSEQGLDLRLGARVTSTKIINNKIMVEYQDNDGIHAVRVDKLIVASGRIPSTDGLASAKANLLLDEHGFVNVNENCRTNLPGVYAIGDLNASGPLLAHKGIAEGNYVANLIAGFKMEPINYSLIPNIIYTDPEIAWIGQTEQTLKSLGDPIYVGIASLHTNARARTSLKPNGLVKIIASVKTDRILGIHIIGDFASELIAEANLALEFSASSEDICNTFHSYPSFSQAMQQAAASIHSQRRNQNQ